MSTGKGRTRQTGTRDTEGRNSGTVSTQDTREHGSTKSEHKEHQHKEQQCAWQTRKQEAASKGTGKTRRTGARGTKGSNSNTVDTRDTREHDSKRSTQKKHQHQEQQECAGSTAARQRAQAKGHVARVWAPAVTAWSDGAQPTTAWIGTKESSRHSSAKEEGKRPTAQQAPFPPKRTKFTVEGKARFHGRRKRQDRPRAGGSGYGDRRYGYT